MQSAESDPLGPLTSHLPAARLDACLGPSRVPVCVWEAVRVCVASPWAPFTLVLDAMGGARSVLAACGALVGSEVHTAVVRPLLPQPTPIVYKHALESEEDSMWWQTPLEVQQKRRKPPSTTSSSSPAPAPALPRTHSADVMIRSPRATKER